MPIQLPPISRRQFLRRTIGASASLWLAPHLIAEDKPVAQHTWALLSDPHISADRTKVSRGVNMTDHLKAVVQEVMDLKQRPAYVLMNGDAAFQLGEAEDYAVFTELVEPLRKAQMPIHLTLGNHDDRDHILTAVPEAKEGQGAVSDKLVSIVRTPRANWFLLDSLEIVGKGPGLLGDAQLAWLGKVLDENKDKPAIVVTHHTPDVGTNKGGLKDTQQLLDVLEPRRHVKAYIYGHSHKWELIKRDSGLHLINLPAIAYVFKEGNPSGWVLATVEENALRLELSCLDKDHKLHGTAVKLDWRNS